VTFRRLNQDELRTLTGRRRRDAITRWLRASGYIFDIDALGWPIVSEDYVRDRLGGRPPEIGGAEPDFEALERAA
jgi:hypothetical protein